MCLWVDRPPWHECNMLANRQHICWQTWHVVKVSCWLLSHEKGKLTPTGSWKGNCEWTRQRAGLSSANDMFRLLTISPLHYTATGSWITVQKHVRLDEIFTHTNQSGVHNVLCLQVFLPTQNVRSAPGYKGKCFSDRLGRTELQSIYECVNTKHQQVQLCNIRRRLTRYILCLILN